MGQFSWVLMWNDMPNQKVVFESFQILHQNMFQVQVLDFKLITVYGIQQFVSITSNLWVNKWEPHGYILIWIIIGSTSYILATKHLHRKDISTEKKIVVPRLKLTYFRLCPGVSTFAVSCQLWVILNNSEQVGAI